MSFEVSHQGITQREDCAEHDKDGIETLAKMLGEVAYASPEPNHVKTGKGNGEGSHHVDAAVPTMQARCAATDVGNELKSSAEQDDDSGGKMNRDHQIGHGP